MVDSNAYNDNNVEMSVVLDQSLDSNKLLHEHISQMQPFYLMRSTPRKILFYFPTKCWYNQRENSFRT
jgi:hypothetical protein